jgi:hypothetical protein
VSKRERKRERERESAWEVVEAASHMITHKQNPPPTPTEKTAMLGKW